VTSLGSSGANALDVNRRHPLGWTALHAAAAMGDEELVALLIDMGADVNLADESDWLRAALLDTHTVEEGALRRQDVSAIFTSHGSTPQSFGCTPLHYAVLANRPGVARLLVAAGADPARPNRLGHPALEIAHPHFKPALVAAIQGTPRPHDREDGKLKLTPR